MRAAMNAGKPAVDNLNIQDFCCASAKGRDATTKVPNSKHDIGRGSGKAVSIYDVQGAESQHELPFGRHLTRHNSSLHLQIAGLALAKKSATAVASALLQSVSVCILVGRAA